MEITLKYDEMVQMIEDNRKPFLEHREENILYRYFYKNSPKHLFKWHHDEENRVVEILNETDWKFQFDNEIPFAMNKGSLIKIPKGIIHRVIPGDRPLTIKILEE